MHRKKFPFIRRHKLVEGSFVKFRIHFTATSRRFGRWPSWETHCTACDPLVVSSQRYTCVRDYHALGREAAGCTSPYAPLPSLWTATLGSGK